MKSAIIIDWLGIFQPPGNKLKSPFFLGCMFLLAVQFISGVGLELGLNLQCRPHNAIWEFWVPRECYDLITVQLISSSTQVVTDVFMLLLPQKSIWDLQLSFHKKLGVSLVFSLGIL